MGSRKERKEPRPALVCPLAPLPAEVLAAAPAVSSIDDELNREACALIDSLIAQGAEVGVHCVAYHHGRLVLDVLAGVCARQAAPLDADGKLLFEPVTPETRFMCYSVAKGVAATVLARALDSDSSGYADPYEMPVAAVWPEFAHGGKGAVTIGDALSHRAGLHPAWPVPPPVLAALLGRLLGTSAGGADGRTGHACVQLAGEGWIAGCTPAWAYDRARPRAAYHATSWSWLVTGLCAHLEHSPERRATPCPPAVQGGCARQHVRDGCRELARALRVPLCQLQIGEADPGGAAAGGSRSLLGAADGPVSLLLRPRSHALLGAGARECAAFARLRLLRAAELGAVVLCGASGDGSAAGRLAEGCLLCVLWPLALWLCAARWVLLGCLSLACTAETFCFVSLGNSAPFLRLCLPSSNLMATAGALGKLYGALANGGSLEGAQALSPEVLLQLCAHADDESRDAPAPGLLCRLLPKGRYTCGFSPFLGSLLEREIAGQQAAIAATSSSSACISDPNPAASAAHLAAAFTLSASHAAAVPKLAGALTPLSSTPGASSTPSTATGWATPADWADGAEAATEGVESVAASPRTPSSANNGAAPRSTGTDATAPSARRCILGHNGVGGCVAYADVHARLAVVLLKNAYTAEAAQLARAGGPGLCVTARLLDALVRAHVLGGK